MHTLKPLSQWTPKRIKVIFTDIDDTLTHHGQLGPEAYTSLWKLHQNGIQVVPITGRPAGWCEMIARFWPVVGVIGENGAFYFSYKNGKMQRHFVYDPQEINENRLKLNRIQKEIQRDVPGCAVASDQFCRLFDLAIDFCEDVPPLAKSEIERIVQIFKKHGAQAKVSSIHVNGWFGDYDKLSMCKTFCEKELNLSIDADNSSCAFVGDSPNDEPMFDFFKNSIGVANVLAFKDQMKSLPKFVTQQQAGHGFTEMTKHLILSPPK